MFRLVESNKVSENELRSIRKCDVGHDRGGDRGKRCVCVCFYLYIYIYIYILVLYNFLYYVTSLPGGISL